jgi:carboxylate-amine ligase
MPASFSHVLAIAAIVRNMVIGAQRSLQEKDGEQVTDMHSYWIAAENKWLAARFGLEAQCIRTPRSKLHTLGEDIKRLLTLVRPIAKESGEEVFLDSIGPLAEFETGSERQRRVYRESGDWGVVVEDMKDRWAKELEITMKREG